MTKEFNFGHLANPPTIGDSMHFHAYRIAEHADKIYRLTLHSRLGTDAEGIARCLGLQAEARIEIDQIIKALQAKLSSSTLFKPL